MLLHLFRQMFPNGRALIGSCIVSCLCLRARSRTRRQEKYRHCWAKVGPQFVMASGRHIPEFEIILRSQQMDPIPKCYVLRCSRSSGLSDAVFYGVPAPLVHIFSIKCLVFYRAGRIYSMKSLVLYRAGSEMLCFTVFPLLGPTRPAKA